MQRDLPCRLLEQSACWSPLFPLPPPLLSWPISLTEELRRYCLILSSILLSSPSTFPPSLCSDHCPAYCFLNIPDILFCLSTCICSVLCLECLALACHLTPLFLSCFTVQMSLNQRGCLSPLCMRIAASLFSHPSQSHCFNLFLQHSSTSNTLANLFRFLYYNIQSGISVFFGAVLSWVIYNYNIQ